MNHLAHCMLSFGDEALLTGNFMGDYVKGNQWERYPAGIQKGILLHRSIDAFTDGHPKVQLSVSRIRGWAGRYAGPVTDILYDHLLCRSWGRHTQRQFDDFAQQTYNQLAAQQEMMPPGLQRHLPAMISGRFLHGYQHREGLEFVFGKFARRLPVEVDFHQLLEHFFENMALFQSDFDYFFPELLEKARSIAENE